MFNDICSEKVAYNMQLIYALSLLSFLLEKPDPPARVRFFFFHGLVQENATLNIYEYPTLPGGVAEM